VRRGRLRDFPLYWHATLKRDALVCAAPKLCDPKKCADQAVGCWPDIYGGAQTCNDCSTGYDSSLCKQKSGGCTECSGASRHISSCFAKMLPVLIHARCAGCPSPDGLNFFDGVQCSRITDYFRNVNPSKQLNRLCAPQSVVWLRVKDITMQECARACQTDSFCDGFHYIWKGHWCQLLATTADTGSQGQHVELSRAEVQRQTSVACTIVGTFEYYTKTDECASDPCQNGGVCTPGTKSYTCTCAAGYKGSNCEQDINECAVNNGNCDSLRQCVNFNGSSSCASCPQGYENQIDALGRDILCRQINECTERICIDKLGWTDKNGVSCSGYTNIPGVSGKVQCSTASRYRNSTDNTDASAACCECNNINCATVPVVSLQQTLCQDACATVPGQAQGVRCTDLPGSYSCGACPYGFIGDGSVACTDIDECLNPNSCDNLTKCTNLVGYPYYDCSLCPPGYAGNSDSRKSKKGCQEIDECLSSPCQHHSPCSDLVNDYNCTCLAGFIGHSCENNIDECLITKNACNENTKQGKCLDAVNGYICDCNDGWSGTNCDKPVMPCAKLEKTLCDKHSKCTHTGPGTHNCTCHVGYVGSGNKFGSGEGAKVTSPSGVVMSPLVTVKAVDAIKGFTTYQLSVKQTGNNIASIYGILGDRGTTLSFPPAYQEAKPFGVDIGGVKNTTFRYSSSSQYDSWLTVGLSDGDSNQQLVQTGINFAGWTSTSGLRAINGHVRWKEPSKAPKSGNVLIAQITVDSTVKWEVVVRVMATSARANSIVGDSNTTLRFRPAGGCTQVDDCSSSPCKNGATCTDRLHSYRCQCVQGFKADECELEIDECESLPCQNNARCTDLKNAYNCTCQPGFKGPLCQTEESECKSSPCKHGATCNEGIFAYNCTCPGGWTGFNCEVDIDECASAPCYNGAVCTEYIDAFNCTCADGWMGHQCERDIDECRSRLRTYRDGYYGYADQDNGGCDVLTQCVNFAGGWYCGHCPIVNSTKGSMTQNRTVESGYTNYFAKRQDFRLRTEPLSWKDGEAYCKRFGRHLAHIDSTKSNAKVAKILKTLNHPAWIGLARDSSCGANSLSWSDGSSAAKHYSALDSVTESADHGFSPVVTVIKVDGATGYITYRLEVVTYANRSIYAITGDAHVGMSFPPSFQSPSNGVNIGGVDPQKWTSSNLAQYDSWLTVGITDGNTQNNLMSTGIDFGSWSMRRGIRTKDGSVFLKDPSKAKVGVNVTIAQLSVADGTSWQAIVRVKGHDYSGKVGAWVKSGDVTATLMFTPNGATSVGGWHRGVQGGRAAAKQTTNCTAKIPTGISAPKGGQSAGECVYINPDGTWARGSCDTRLHFVCGPHPTPVPSGGFVECIDIDECADDNGGCDYLSLCSNTEGSYECGDCPSVYTNVIPSAAKYSPYIGSGDTGCVDVNECSVNVTHGTCDKIVPCTNTEGSFYCGMCPVASSYSTPDVPKGTTTRFTPYTGNGTEACVDIDECSYDNGGCDMLTTCNNSIGSFSCGACPEQYIDQTVQWGRCEWMRGCR
jgi:hypothetical protein